MPDAPQSTDRPPGFYWIKIGGEWTVGEWSINCAFYESSGAESVERGHWLIPGDECYWADPGSGERMLGEAGKVDEVGERILERPRGDAMIGPHVMTDDPQTTEPRSECEFDLDHIYSPTGWQPIETAPRDRWFLAFGTHSRNLSTQMVIRWDGDYWQSSDDGFAPYLTPIHWMPLPEPPANTTEAAIKATLETAITQWVGDQIAAGNPGFDFWDECDTSAALAEHLVQLWWPR